MPVTIELSSSDGFLKTGKVVTPNESCPAGVSCNACVFSSICEVLLDYHPKSTGKQIITFTVNDVIKTVDILVTPYMKIDPQVINVTNLDINYNKNLNHQTIGNFEFTQADEPMTVDKIEYSSDFSWVDGFLQIQTGNGQLIFAGPSGFVPSNPLSSQLKLMMQLNSQIDAYGNSRFQISTGKHSIIINKVTLIGQSSGAYRYVFNLPITFTFEVK